MLIEYGKPKITSDNYLNLFGKNSKVSEIFSKVQSAAIKIGIELENLILKNVLANGATHITNTGQYNEAMKSITGQIYICSGKELKIVAPWYKYKNEPDFIVIINKDVYIIELKYGSAFDTKKSSAEIETLRFINAKYKKQYPSHNIYHKICLFTCTTNENIVTGFKNKCKKHETITATELCKLLNINLTNIHKSLEADGDANITYVVNTLLKVTGSYGIIIDNVIKQHGYVKTNT